MTIVKLSFHCILNVTVFFMLEHSKFPRLSQIYVYTAQTKQQNANLLMQVFNVLFNNEKGRKKRVLKEKWLVIEI